MSIFDRGEWNQLVILDACRHDLYEQVVGPTPKRITLGSSSPEYIDKTYSNGDFSDVVYISSNPFFHAPLFKKLTGRDVEEVFHAVYHSYLDDWNEAEHTVLPDALAETARQAADTHPGKRIVVHFMQPHHPFVPKRLSDEGFSNEMETGNYENHVWAKCERGELDTEEVWETYKANLEYVLPYARSLGNTLPGKAVITADHGNLVGENNLFGHPAGSDAAVLRTVPWEVL